MAEPSSLKVGDGALGYTTDCADDLASLIGRKEIDPSASADGALVAPQ